jgi:hypothetical protein
MRDNRFTVIDAEKLKRSSFKLPHALLALQENAKTFLGSQLATVFDHVDDTFFDLADQADNNRNQTMYFDAMRLIRVERRAIEHHFFNTLASNFQRLGDEKYRGDSMSSKKGQGLELIDNDDLEEIIALDTMVSKTSELCKAELETLSFRIDSLVPAMISAKNNPIGPDTICEAFNSAVAHLELSVPAKLVFYKLFDRHVMTPIKAFLVQNNRHLKEMGVLPDLELRRKAQVKKPVVDQKPKKSDEAHEHSGDRQSSQNHQSSQSYQSSQKGTDRSQSGTSGVRQTGRRRYGQLISQLKNIMQWKTSNASSSLTEGGESRTVLDTLQLVSKVADIQSEWREQANDPLQSDKGLLALIEDSLGRQGDGALGTTERGMVDLLDQLFAKVNTQAIAAEEIAREFRKLELPIFQVALKDATFFDREKHPARRLLNEIAEAAIGYVDGVDVHQDPVAKAIAQVSEALYNENQLDNTALTQLLLNFIELVEKERRRVTALEQRLLEEVAATEKVNQAHQAVVKVLIERIQGKTLPRFLVSFAEDAWCKVLFLAYLKSGADSEAWNTRIQLLDQLLEVVSGQVKEAASEESIRVLVGHLRQHLEDISYDPYDLGRLVGAMEQYFRREKHEPESGEESSLGETSENLLKEVLVDALRTDIPGQSPSPEESQSGNEYLAETIDDQFLRQADSLTRGSWVELEGEEPSMRRCKVAGIISPSGKFVFVNRQGFKVSEKHRNAVALGLQNEKIKPLEKTRLFDRALEGVVADIRQHRSRQ